MIIIYKKWILKNEKELLRRVFADENKRIKKIITKLKKEYDYYKKFDVSFVTPNSKLGEIMKMNNKNYVKELKETTWNLYYVDINARPIPSEEDFLLLSDSDPELYNKILEKINNYIVNDNKDK